MKRFSLVFLVLGVFLLMPVTARGWKVQRDEFNPAMLERYKSMLSSNPDDDFAFRKLTLLYQTHSSLDRLLLEYHSLTEKNPRNYAAYVVLGKLYMQIDRFEESLAALEKARTIDPARYEAWKLLGEWHMRKRQYAQARTFLDGALERITTPAVRERTLRDLVRLCVLGGDPEGGAKYFASLIQLKPNDFQTRWDYAEILAEAMQFDDARREYDTLFKMAAGDTRRKVDVLKATGILLERMGRDTEAVDLYWKAMAMTAPDHWVRNELIGRMVAIARRRDELPKLLREFKKRWPQPNAFQATVIASIHGEIGEFDNAFAYYRQALRQEPANVDIRLEFISLLEKSGADPKTVILEQEALVRSVPEQARFAVELARRYEKAGMMREAVALAEKLLSQHASDASMLLALAELFGQWNKPARVIQIYEKLIVLEPTDPEHYINLGQLYWARGERPKAVAIWEKILRPGIVDEPGEAHNILAGVYMEAGRLSEALAQARAAVAKKPKETAYLFLLGQVLIKNQQLPEAEKTFENALQLAMEQSDAAMARKVRKQMIKLWQEMNVLEARLDERRKAWSADQIDRGMFLAEGYLQLGQWEKAMELYQKMRAAQPSLSEPLLGLIALYEGLGRYQDYIRTLEEAVRLVPHRAKEFYEQLSAAWAVAGNDAKARMYLQMALEKDTRDSKSWAKAGELAMKLEDFKGAIRAFQEAIRLDPYEMSHYFRLAFLQQQEGQLADAAVTYHQVIARASEDETVERAGRFALELGEITGELGKLEKVLHPLSFTYAHRPVFSRLLLETYRRYVPILYRMSRSADSLAQRKAAQDELARIASRALKPLLDVLSSENVAEQENARTLLAQLGNSNAAIPLVRMARRTVETAQKRLQEKPDVREFLSAFERTFVLKSLLVAALIGDASIVSDLEFFAESVPQLPPAQLYALWGLSRLEPRSAIFVRLLQKSQNHDALVLACHTVASYARQPLLSVIENDGLLDRTRGLCLEAYARYASLPEFSQLATRISATGSPEMRQSLQNAKRIASRTENFAEMAALYWMASEQERIGIVNGMLMAAGVRDRRDLQPERPVMLAFGEEQRLYPWLRELFSAAGQRIQNEQDLWHRVLTLSDSIDLSSVRMHVVGWTLPPGSCPHMERIVEPLENALKDLRPRNPRELENFLAAWEDGFALSGFSRLCGADAAQAAGRRLWNRVLPKIEEYRAHPYAFVRQKAWYLLVMHDPRNLETMLAQEKWPDAREAVLARLLASAFPLRVPEMNAATPGERELLLRLRLRSGKPDAALKSALASSDVLEVSLALDAADSLPSLDCEWLIPALSHPSIHVAQTAAAVLRKHCSDRASSILSGLSEGRRSQLRESTGSE